MNKEYSIDASGRTLGRVAADAAKALMGKKSADYTPNAKPEVKVRVLNVSKLMVSEKKRLAKTYTSYSGFPGGLKRESLSSLSSRKGYGAALKRAIERMLPRNASRNARMKNLVISE